MGKVGFDLVDGKKKILILGGTRHMIDVVKTANAMGFYTIVADNVVGSPAKAHAAKFLMKAQPIFKRWRQSCVRKR